MAEPGTVPFGSRQHMGQLKSTNRPRHTEKHRSKRATERQSDAGRDSPRWFKAWILSVRRRFCYSKCNNELILGTMVCGIKLGLDRRKQASSTATALQKHNKSPIWSARGAVCQPPLNTPVHLHQLLGVVGEKTRPSSIFNTPWILELPAWQKFQGSARFKGDTGHWTNSRRWTTSQPSVKAYVEYVAAQQNRAYMHKARGTFCRYGMDATV